MRVDKMTMAHSIEARVPFLDHDLVEFAMRLPPSYKLSEGLGKKILKKMAEPYVDHDLLYRRKQGFGAPMDKWFQDPGFGRECLVRAGALDTLTRRLPEQGLHHGTSARPGLRAGQLRLPPLDCYECCVLA